jgi:hypothetical protein
VGFDQCGIHVQRRHRHPPVRLEESEQRSVHSARIGSAIAGMIALPGGRGWPAAASWNRASHIAEGDGTARRLPQAARSVRLDAGSADYWKPPLRARFESVRALRSPLHIPPLSYFCRGRTHELCCKFASVHTELILSSHLY